MHHSKFAQFYIVTGHPRKDQQCLKQVTWPASIFHNIYAVRRRLRSSKQRLAAAIQLIFISSQVQTSPVTVGQLIWWTCANDYYYKR